MWQFLYLSLCLCAPPAADTPADSKQAPMKPVDQPPTAFATYPDLPKAITSFGAAVLDDGIYVYGGFEGAAHHYYDRGQSGDLLRLSFAFDLKPDAHWETVATGPRLQGLALVASGDAIYRLGGFEARNKEGDKQDLWSVRRFRPLRSQDGARGARCLRCRRRDLRSTPSPLATPCMRSGAGSCAATRRPFGRTRPMPSIWRPNRRPGKKLPKPPFQRRALAVGSFRNRVYAIGGMQSDGKVTRRVAVYTPGRVASWSEGPELPRRDDGRIRRGLLRDRGWFFR